MIQIPGRGCFREAPFERRPCADVTVTGALTLMICEHIPFLVVRLVIFVYFICLFKQYFNFPQNLWTYLESARSVCCWLCPLMFTSQTCGTHCAPHVQPLQACVPQVKCDAILGLSKATCYYVLICVCMFRCVKDHPNSLHCSPWTNHALDEWC